MRILAALAFFLSGASSLVFQSLWGRMLQHVFGSSSLAVATVVTGFMGGLGLGAWWAARWGDRVRRPLLAYAAVEAAVALWALLLPSLLSPTGALAAVNGALRQWAAGSTALLVLARFAATLPVILLPTTLMGASLPLLSRWFVDAHCTDGRQVGHRVGLLYALNTAGAVLGVLLTTFILLPYLGLHRSHALAIGTNLSLAALLALSWVLRGRRPDGTPSVSRNGPDISSSPPPHEPLSRPSDPLVRRVALGVFALAGLMSLGYEVVWTRALALTIGSSVYAFGIILAVFLAGLAGGSALASALEESAPEVAIGRVAAVGLGASLLPAATWWVAAEPAMGLLLLLLEGTLVLTVLRLYRGRLRMARAAEVPALSPPLPPPALFILWTPPLGLLLGAPWLPGGLTALSLGALIALSLLATVLLLLRRHPLLRLGATLGSGALAALLVFMAQDELPCVFSALLGRMEDLAAHVGLVQGTMFVTAAANLLPATVAIGAVFPLVLRIESDGGGTVARDVGRVYAANTVGSVLGAWLPGFLLVPTLGIEGTLRAIVLLGAALALALALLAWRRATEEPARHAARAVALGSAALLGLVALGSAAGTEALRWDRMKMTLGVFRVSSGRNACSDLPWEDGDGPRLVYYRDGLVTTVSVERWDEHLALKNNGKVDASNGQDMPTQILVAGYPLLLHPRGGREARVAVVGWGSGVTVGSALRFPVAEVIAAELEPSVLEASWWFREVNRLPFASRPGSPGWAYPYVRSPRLRAVADDGRNFLASASERFDVVVSEPSNPWIAGVASLFTTEHFRVSSARLADDGIYCQWVQLYELSPRLVKVVLRTFAEAFPHVRVFAADRYSSDTVLLGSRRPIPLDLAHLEAAWRNPEIAQEMARAGLHRPADVLARQLFASRQEVLRYAQVEWRHQPWCLVVEDGDLVSCHASESDAQAALRELRPAWPTARVLHDPSHWRPYWGATNAPEVPCGKGCRRKPAPLNTDDNGLLEFGAPLDLVAYERYRGFFLGFYETSWPYGRVAPASLLGVGSRLDAARRLTEVARSMLEHGRKPEAASFLEAAQARGALAETARLAVALARLLEPIEQAPPLRMEPLPPWNETLDRAAHRSLQRTLSHVATFVRAGRFEEALEALEAVPLRVREAAGPSLQALHAWLLLRTAPEEPERYAGTIHLLERLTQEESDYAARHPELHYLLARAYDADLSPEEALAAMLRYVDAPRFSPPQGREASFAPERPGAKEGTRSRGPEPSETPRPR